MMNHKQHRVTNKNLTSMTTKNTFTNESAMVIGSKSYQFKKCFVQFKIIYLINTYKYFVKRSETSFSQ